MENSEHSEYFMENYSDETKNRLLKYWCQQAGIVVDNGEDVKEYVSLIDWINDGSPTGIASPEEFYSLQEAVYGKIIQTLYIKPLHRVEYFYVAVNHYKRYDFDKVVCGGSAVDGFVRKNVPYRCTAGFFVGGLCVLEHLEKDRKVSFQKLTDGVYGLKASPEEMNSIVCKMFYEEQRIDMLRTVNAFSGTPEIILVAVMDDIPDKRDDKRDFPDLHYFIDYHEEPFYDKVMELEHLSSFSCNPDILSRVYKNSMLKSLGFEQGHSLDDYLIKYLHQRNGSRSRDAEIYKDELGDAPHLRARDEWMNDGQPTPIRNDRDFFDIQKKVWGTVKAHIHCCYSVEELIKDGYGKEVRL